jgi:hypothetical protein
MTVMMKTSHLTIIAPLQALILLPILCFITSQQQSGPESFQKQKEREVQQEASSACCPTTLCPPHPTPAPRRVIQRGGCTRGAVMRGSRHGSGGFADIG